MFKKNRKGQGALEYLLLIGGAVLIAVIVIALLV
ncbi:MAG: class III signal peptide-containing protein, partial [Candidatus ainarchaeum sp.]|nr:class III signal peptide-containing protein [Candidatus ainarchaeum sp.]